MKEINHDSVFIIMEISDTTIGDTSKTTIQADCSPDCHIMENKPPVTQMEAQDIFMEAYFRSPDKAADVLRLYKDILHVAQTNVGV